LEVLNRSAGSVIIRFFFVLTEADGFVLSLEKETLTPVGNCNAGLRHALASVLDRDVLY
jgi:hypothetical protein